MSNYPAGVSTRDIDDGYPTSSAKVLTCDICKTAVEQVRMDDFFYVRSGIRADAGHYDRTFVCSSSCKSQMIYNLARESEKRRLRALAQMFEWNAVLRGFADTPKQEDVATIHVHRRVANPDTVYARFFDADDVFELYGLMNKIGVQLAGDGSMDAPAWYIEATAERPERQPVRETSPASVDGAA